MAGLSRASASSKYAVMRCLKMGVIFSYTKNEQSDAESFIKALVFINKLRGNDFVGKDNIFNRLEKNWLKTEQTKKEFYLDFMLNAATSGQTNPQEHRDVIEALKAFDLVDSFMADECINSIPPAPVSARDTAHTSALVPTYAHAPAPAMTTVQGAAGFSREEAAPRRPSMRGQTNQASLSSRLSRMSLDGDNPRPFQRRDLHIPASPRPNLTHDDAAYWHEFGKMSRIGTPCDTHARLYLGGLSNDEGYPHDLSDCDLIINLSGEDYRAENRVKTSDDHVHRVSVNDDPRSWDQLLRALPKIRGKLQNAISQQQKIYVHCLNGQSRSVAVLIWFFCKEYGCTFSEAKALIQDKRPVLKCKFEQQLMSLFPG
ncbi:dual specificity protein phosphatase family protein [Endozoicomonas sp.]|uniref:dual specificity protein phosphatase family protein n=1 Tax=Endozoicomonas sp. TaxID=1892382 RepID=UPI003AF82C8C